MKRITQCRACGSTALAPAFQFETIEDAPRRKGGSTSAKGRTKQKKKTSEFVVCDATQDAEACGLLQRAECDASTADRAPSGFYRSNRGHLRAAATEALELISGRDCAALDIGCSDGTLLSFYPRWVDRVGVDTADIVERVGAWATTHKASFPSRELDEAFAGRKFDLISAISVLEDVDEPRPFLNNAKSLLTDDGVLIIETLYAPMMLTRTNVDAVFNGRSAVYSLGSLERLFRDCGLKIFRGSLTDKEGGSIRLFATHADLDDYDFDPWYERLARLWDEENALALRLLAPYQAYEQRVDEVRAGFQKLVSDICRDGETVHLLGADASARQLYAWAGKAASSIEAAISPTEPEEGARLFPGGPELIGEAAARALEADVFIAGAAHKRDLLERWRDPILRGATMIFATPTPHVVTSANYSAEFGKALVGADGSGGPETLRAILGAAGGPRLVVENGDDDRAAASA
ncbi:MAG: class I SAM-dependent methyltransferase [Pseudomonadota bacterium]